MISNKLITSKYSGVVAAGGDLFNGPGLPLQLHKLGYGVVLHVTGAKLPLVVTANRVDRI